MKMYGFRKIRALKTALIKSTREKHTATVLVQL